MTEPKPETKLYSYQNLQQIIQNIPDTQTMIILLIAYGNGTRVKEATTTTYQDIRWDEQFLQVATPVLKKRKKTTIKRNNPISRKLEPWITEPIITYAQLHRTDEYDNRQIFTKSKRTLQRYCHKYIGANSHALRHNRATHLKAMFDFDDRDLKEYFQLSDSGMTAWVSRYAHYSKTYLRDKFEGMIK